MSETGLSVSLTVTTMLPDNIVASVIQGNIVVNGNIKKSDRDIIYAVAHELAHLLGNSEHDASHQEQWEAIFNKIYEKYKGV